MNINLIRIQHTKKIQRLKKRIFKRSSKLFEMVIESFVKGDLKNIEMYIDDKLIKNFKFVINERLQEEEVLKLA